MEQNKTIEEKQQQIEEESEELSSSEQESECEEMESNHITYILVNCRPQKILTASYKRYISEYERKFLHDLERSYLNSEESEDLEEIAQSRSGTVYKLKHDGKTLAMKLCHYFAVDRKGKRIVEELREETRVYQMLRNAKGPWPNLYFADYIFNQNFYAIVTEFIDGRHPKKEDLADFELCKVALQTLHGLGIVHGDPRPANFLISNGHAIILDFGFSVRFGHSACSKDISIMKKSFGI